MKITIDDEKQVREYVQRQKDRGKTMDWIIDHLIYGIITKSAGYVKRANHTKTGKHIKNRCSLKCWCRTRRDEPELIKRKIDFRIKALIILGNSSF